MKKQKNRTAVATFILCVAIGIAGSYILHDRRPRQSVEVMGGTALGTFYRITVVGAKPEGIERELDSLFEAANRSMSIFDESSLLSRINRGETDTLNTEIVRCIAIAKRASTLSDGLYDITVAPLAEAMGFGRGKAADEPNIDSILEFVGYRKFAVEGSRIVKSDPRISLDLNSVAKGATVDMAAALLERRGVANYLVDIGGEIFCRGKNGDGKRWTVGIETPFEGNYSVSGEYIERVIEVSNCGVATSGNYRNFRTDDSGRKYTHIINPLTGENTASNLLSATVIADDCATADAFGTMFIALGLERAEKVADEENLAVLLIYADADGAMRTWASTEMRPYLK